jgi:hypothetical protein
VIFLASKILNRQGRQERQGMREQYGSEIEYFAHLGVLGVLGGKQ